MFNPAVNIALKFIKFSINLIADSCTFYIFAANLNILDMVKDLCIKVYPSGGIENKPLLERHLRIDDGVSVPYGQLIYALQILFGDKSIITFNYF